MIYTILGVFCGIVTGLIPGLHINTFIPFLSETNLTGFVVGVVIAHSFFDFFPAVFLGIPDDGTALSLLPAHKMVLKGKALFAFHLSVFGGLFCSLIALVFLPFLFFLSFFDLRGFVLVVLLLTISLLLFTAKNKLLTVAVFLFSGMIGFAFIGNPNSLLALFSGFFGASTMIFSLLKKTVIPPQEHTSVPFPGSKPLFFGSLAGLFSGLFPGVSSSVSGLVVEKIGRINEEDFLVVLGGANTVYAFTAIFAVYIVGSPRSGAGLLIGEVNPLLLLANVLVALALSAFLAFFLGKRVISLFNRLPLRLLNVVSLVFLVLMNLFFGVFFLFVISTCVGLVCVFSGVRRSTCMGSLLLPAILYYLA
ncbi:tripartite tricarboxylate transporter permease [archaeon]|nr:tripartite tricarboxylate transporter permease [archaeon]